MPTERNCGMGGSTITVGELRAALAELADGSDLPVTIHHDGWWLNVSEVEDESQCAWCGVLISWDGANWIAEGEHGWFVCEAGTSEEHHAPTSLVIGTTDDFDTRQF